MRLPERRIDDALSIRRPQRPRGATGFERQPRRRRPFGVKEPDVPAPLDTDKRDGLPVRRDSRSANIARLPERARAAAVTATPHQLTATAHAVRKRDEARR